MVGVDRRRAIAIRWSSRSRRCPSCATFAVTPDAIVLGAGLPLTDIEEHLHATPEAAVPLLGQLLPLFSSRLIRNRATLGGNLVDRVADRRRARRCCSRWTRR